MLLLFNFASVFIRNKNPLHSMFTVTAGVNEHSAVYRNAMQQLKILALILLCSGLISRSKNFEVFVDFALPLKF